MRLLHVMLIGALAAVPAVMSGSSPAQAARFCKCTNITSSGFCTAYGECHVLLESVGTRPLRSTKDCRRSQALVCDDIDNSCKPVCAATPKPSAR